MEKVKVSPSSMEATMAIAALSYAERGFKVFPLNGKHPLISGGKGYLDASNDPDQTRDWWSEYPDANIGLPMAPNGMVALDIDPRNGGDDTLISLIAEHGQLPDTVLQKTGGGGWHYVFRNNNKSFRSPGLGIDIKDKGYIVAAPSIHPDTGKEYEWDKPLELDLLADPPNWLNSVHSVADHKKSLIGLFDDPVFLALHRLGRAECDDNDQPIVRYAANGTEKINITCPWVHEHTDKADDGTAYFAGGGFKCHHAHCDGRRMKDLFCWLSEQGEDVERLRQIQRSAIDDAQLLAFSRFSDAISTGPSFFNDGVQSTDPLESYHDNQVERLEMPDYPPGLVGKIARFVEGGLTYAMPNIALATALSAVSRMISNRAVAVAPTGRKTPLNLYIVITAQSGAGKETSRTVLNQIGQSVAGENLISSNPASPQALGRMLSQGPRTSVLLFQDEFGKKLEHANSGSAAHDAAVNAMLLELFPLGLGSYAGRTYAKQKDDVQAAEQPYVCLLAATTLEPFSEALQDTAIYDGTLNRLLYLPQPVKLVRNDNLSYGEVPEEIIEHCKLLWNGSEVAARLVAGLDLQQAPNTVTSSGGLYRAVSMTDEAHGYFDNFDRELDRIKEIGGARAALAARATELAIRVAGVVAVGCANNLDDVQLDLSHAQYGVTLVRYSMAEMLNFVDEELVSINPRQLTRRILEFCHECVEHPSSIKLPRDRERLREHFVEGLVSRTVLAWKFKNGITKRDRNDAIETLTESGDLIAEERKISGQSTMLFRPQGVQLRRAQ
jgi:hypothetical protein